jgi:acetyl esterase
MHAILYILDAIMHVDGKAKDVEQEVRVTDVEYLRTGHDLLLARVYEPAGDGPVPGVVNVHGGAWYLGDRLRDHEANLDLAQSGVLVAAIDYRMPPAHPYPASMADLNHAVRWLKGHHRQPTCVGVMGTSSGGHMSMLAAMRPDDPRYAAHPHAGLDRYDASVAFAVLRSPVIDPLGRYRHFMRFREQGLHQNLTEMALPGHDAYWPGGEDAMAEASPLAILTRAEPVCLPPVLYIQGTEDLAHPLEFALRFVELYRQAGGRVEMNLHDGAIYSMTSGAQRAEDTAVVDFVRTIAVSGASVSSP